MSGSTLECTLYNGYFFFNGTSCGVKFCFELQLNRVVTFAQLKLENKFINGGSNEN